MYKVKYKKGKLQVGVEESLGLEELDIVVVNNEVFMFTKGWLAPVENNSKKLTNSVYDCLVIKDIHRYKRESFLKEYDSQHFISERHAVLWALDWKFSFDYLRNL